MKSEWKYEDLLELGYKRFKLTRKQHDELFPKRKLRWSERYEYYFNDKIIVMHRFTTLFAKLLLVITFPISLLIFGVGNFKEIVRDHKEVLNEKKYGSYSTDTVPKKSEKYSEVMNAIKENER